MAALARLGFGDMAAPPPCAALPGGVSSDIWRVDLADGPVCVKRALARLKVAADWRAPVARNAYEVAWFRTAARFAPAAVPPILAHDPAAGLFVMPYLDPARHRNWKAELLAGRVDPAVAAAVGGLLARIHAGTAGDGQVAARFATDAIFHAIRLEPYLEATARAHPDLAPALAALVATTAGTHRALVHGDVSPKNILLGPGGPVFLDAECAWYGDPAFDLAFCLNHFLLKALVVAGRAGDLLACFAAMAGAYLDGVDWEPAADLEDRAARLLPGLFLARVDGKSPAEYLTDPADRDRVRRAATDLLRRPVAALDGVADRWRRELAP
ncbi:MAG: phosphotransferase [Hyphomicrobiales bacterium]|nr:phosphotransferase [Hyphomicrobiales bacterium]